MKSLTCKALGDKTCSFVAEGETPEEVAETMFEHANVAHKENIDKMMKKMTEEEIKEMMASKVK